MAARPDETSEQRLLVTWRRDYRSSLVLVFVGIAMVAAAVIVSVWASSAEASSTSFSTGLAVQVIGTGGGMLILLAGTVAYYHRRGLEQNATNS